MTNGEKIKTIFPSMEIIPNPYSPSVDTQVGGIMMMRIDRNWFNAEYKESIRPKGHWFVDERPESDREIICSNCEQPIFKYHKIDFDYRPKYCPNCGVDMRESEEV